MYDFITDLDGYFCETYANYDKLCILPGYVMPVMQRSEVRADGRTYAYTLPAETMRLANQEKKEEILRELKSRLTDITFSFSFRPVGKFARIHNLFSKFAFYKNLKLTLKKYGVSLEEAGKGLDVSEEIWKNIVHNDLQKKPDLRLDGRMLFIRMKNILSCWPILTV